jgi:adenylylsulfate kinase
MIDSRSRSLAKAVSYRVLGSLSTAAMVLFFTGNVKMSLGAGALDSVVKIVLYFLHERLWNHIPFGKARAPEYEI